MSIATVNNFGLIDSWIYDTLTNDAALQMLFQQSAEPGPVRAAVDVGEVSDKFPFITWAMLTSPVTTSATLDYIKHTSRYQIKCIDRSASYTPSEPIAARLVQLLFHYPVEDRPEGTILSCDWVEDMRYAELTNGQRYVHQGAVFEIQSRVATGN